MAAITIAARINVQHIAKAWRHIMHRLVFETRLGNQS